MLFQWRYTPILRRILSTSLTAALPFLLVLTFAAEVHPQVRCEYVFRASSTTKKTQLEKIWAVHATRALPVEGIVYAGVPPGGQKKSAVFRPELHFALGELVVDHSAGSWSKMPFAILAPLHNLERQLYTLFPQDTVIIGDFVLTPDTVILAPKGTAIPPKLQRHVSFYDPAMTTLREAVDQKIHELNGWSFKADGGFINSHVQFNGLDINSKSFFKDFFIGKEYVDFNLHGARDIGEMDGRIILLMDYFKRGILEPTSNNEAKLEYASFVVKMENFLKDIEQIKLSSLEKQGVTRNIKYFEGFLNILRLDLEVRSQGLGSLFGIKQIDVIEKILELKSEPEKLKDFILTQKSLFVRPPEEPLRHYDLFSSFRYWDEVKRALQLFPEFKAPLGDQVVIKALWHLSQKANWYHLISNPIYSQRILGIDGVESSSKRLLQNAGSEKEIMDHLQWALESTDRFDFYLAHGFLSAFPKIPDRQRLWSLYPNVKVYFSRNYNVEKWTLEENADNPQLLHESRLTKAPRK